MPIPQVNVITLSLPEYKVDLKPDNLITGPKLDEMLIKYYLDQHVVLRCVGLQDHVGKSLDELAQIVLDFGTDKYDPNRSGHGYVIGSSQGKHIDFYGTEVYVQPDTNIFTTELLDDFYIGAQGDRGYPIRIDLVMAYDASKLARVEHLYGDDVEASDGFVFIEPTHKTDALLGLIKIT